MHLRAAGRPVRIGRQQPVPHRPAQPGGYPLGGGEQVGALTVAAGQVCRRGHEPVGEPGHPAGIGAAERVDRRVRVGERDQVRAAPGDQLQQVELGRVGVGQLVEVDRRQPAPFQGEQVGLGLQQAGRGTQQLGRVVGDAGPAGGVAQGQHLEVLAQEAGRGDPVEPAVLHPVGGQLLGRYPPLGAAHQQVAQLGRERPGAQGRTQRRRPLLGVGGEQFADDQILLRSGEQARGRVAELGGRAAQDAEGVGVERAHQRLRRHVLRHPGLDPVAQPGRAAPAERQHQHLVGRRALGDPGGDRLHQRGGLAGARPAEHEQGALAVRGDGTLRVVERHRGGGRCRRAQQPVGHGDYETTGVRHASTASATVSTTRRWASASARTNPRGTRPRSHSSRPV